VGTRRKQSEQGDSDKVAERRLGPTHLGGAVEPGGIDDEDDARDQDFAEPARNEEHRRENDAPETQFRKAHRRCEVEHVPGDPEEQRTEQEHRDECQKRKGEPAGDEGAESEDSQDDAEDGAHRPSLWRRAVGSGGCRERTACSVLMVTVSSSAPEEITAHLDYYKALHKELVSSGELVESEVLAGPDLAKIVTSDGVTAPVVTDWAFSGVQGDEPSRTALPG
jgi:hypothetical protein